MRWAALVARILVGLPFLVFGLNHFLKFMPMDPPPGLPESAQRFGGVLVETHIMDVVKVLEVVGGLLVLTGRLAPLGLVLLVPVTVNIALWDALVMKYVGPPLGTILLALEVFLIYAYRRYFVSVFTTNATVG